MRLLQNENIQYNFSDYILIIYYVAHNQQLCVHHTSCESVQELLSPQPPHVKATATASSFAVSLRAPCETSCTRTKKQKQIRKDLQLLIRQREM